jgi:hypothetical protein
MVIIAIADILAGYLLASLGRVEPLALALVGMCAVSLNSAGSVLRSLVAPSISGSTGHLLERPHAFYSNRIVAIVVVLLASFSSAALWLIPGSTHLQVWVLWALLLVILLWSEAVLALGTILMPVVRLLTFLLGIAANPEIWRIPPERGLGFLAEGNLTWLFIAIPGLIYVSALMRLLLGVQRQVKHLRLVWPTLWMILAALLASEAFPLWLWSRTTGFGSDREGGTSFPFVFSSHHNWPAISTFALLSGWLLFSAMKAVDRRSIRRLVRSSVCGILVIDALVLLSGGDMFRDLRIAGLALLLLLLPEIFSNPSYDRYAGLSLREQTSSSET